MPSTHDAGLNNGWRYLLGTALISHLSLVVIAFGMTDGLEWLFAAYAITSVCLVAMAVYIVGRMRRKQNTPPMWGIFVQVAIWVAAAGPFGAVVCGALLVPRDEKANTRLARLQPAGGGKATQSNEFPAHSWKALQDGRMRISGAHKITPMVDVVLSGSRIMKLEALSHVARQYSASFAPTLQQALEDRDASVRVLAATVIAKQHETFSGRILELEEICAKNPEDLAAWQNLAQAHLRYADSGLLDSSRADAERERGRFCQAKAAHVNVDEESHGYLDRPQMVVDDSVTECTT